METIEKVLYRNKTLLVLFELFTTYILSSTATLPTSDVDISSVPLMIFFLIHKGLTYEAHSESFDTRIEDLLMTLSFILIFQNMRLWLVYILQSRSPRLECCRVVCPCMVCRVLVCINICIEITSFFWPREQSQRLRCYENAVFNLYHPCATQTLSTISLLDLFSASIATCHFASVYLYT